MSDLNDLNKPDGASNYSTEVMQTLRGHITRLWKGDYTGMGNLVAGMLRWAVTGTTTLSARLYQRNSSGSDVEVTILPSVSIGGNAATATTASACTGNAATATTAASCSGNAATATTASACTGNAATATTAASCSGNAATATTASACTGNAATATRTISDGGYNTVGGTGALAANTTGFLQNTAFGYAAMGSNTTGYYNTSFGYCAMNKNTTGYYNVAIGNSALAGNTTGIKNTAVGQGAFFFNNCSNSTALGYGVNINGDNQVQLGDPATTTYVYGTVQNRSDLRDKADIRDTVLGLDFVNALRPVDYRWDMRDFYKPEAPEQPSIERPTDEQSPTYAQDLAAYELAHSDHKILMDAWLTAVKYENLTPNGTKKRIRYHHGLIAQEVKAVIDSTGVDFGGYQDHKIEGGEDVLSIGYDELIAPMIKAVQQLSQQNKDMAARLLALESAA
jgi:Chaperone of endosialidase